MIDLLHQYEQNGHFLLSSDASLSSTTEKVPELPGVFCVYRLARGKEDLVYIGYTHFTGSLRKTLTQQPGSGDAQKFYRDKMQKEGIDALRIHWFVMQRKKRNDDPEVVYLELMRACKQRFGGFPFWQQY